MTVATRAPVVPAHTRRPAVLSSPPPLPRLPEGAAPLFGGHVVDADGARLAGATLDCWGVLRTDQDGSFELLACAPRSADPDHAEPGAGDDEAIRLRVSAPGNQPVHTELGLGTAGGPEPFDPDEPRAVGPDTVTRLTDGTRVVLHTFVLAPRARTRRTRTHRSSR